MVGGLGAQPPVFGPSTRTDDVVLPVQGLQAFDVEYASAIEHHVDGVPVRTLPSNLDEPVAW